MTAAAEPLGRFIDFFYYLREMGVPVSTHEMMDFQRGMEKGLAQDLDQLFVFAKLVFVKKASQADAFERAFAYYFYAIELPPVAEGDLALFHTKAFRDWLKKAIAEKQLPAHAAWTMAPERLMELFWQRVREQMEAHHGGNKWIGTGGTSPFGHSGYADRGIRVHGQGRNRSALKVMGDRRYVDYNTDNQLRGENIRQVLTTLKHIVPDGPMTALDIEATIAQTARQGGEIELVFKREKVDKIKVIMLLDNGGSSMLPFVDLTRLLFSKVRDRFKSCDMFYFHNSIYRDVYRNPARTKTFSTEKLLQKDPATRIIIVGDASMAPEELMEPGGAISYFGRQAEPPSYAWLQQLRSRFRHSVWLNPIPEPVWNHTYGHWTLSRIAQLFPMTDMTLGGIKRAVEHLSGAPVRLRNQEP